MKVLKFIQLSRLQIALLAVLLLVSSTLFVDAIVGDIAVLALITGVGTAAIVWGVWALELAINYSVFSFADIMQDTILEGLWKLARDFTNIFILMAFFMLAIGNIFIPRAGSRVAMVGLVVASIFVNFSAIITLLILDISNILTSFLVTITPADVVRVVEDIVSLQSDAVAETGGDILASAVDQTAGEEEGGFFSFLGEIAKNALDSVMSWIAGVILLFPIALFVCLLAGALLVRLLYAVILVITSPFAAVGFVLLMFGGRGNSAVIGVVMRFMDRWLSWLVMVFLTPLVVLGGIAFATILAIALKNAIVAAQVAGATAAGTDIIKLVLPSLLYAIVLWMVVRYLFGMTAGLQRIGLQRKLGGLWKQTAATLGGGAPAGTVRIVRNLFRTGAVGAFGEHYRKDRDAMKSAGFGGLRSSFRAMRTGGRAAVDKLEKVATPQKPPISSFDRVKQQQERRDKAKERREMKLDDLTLQAQELEDRRLEKKLDKKYGPKATLNPGALKRREKEFREEQKVRHRGAESLAQEAYRKNKKLSEIIKERAKKQP